jgi:GntR family transcriptional regulator
LLKAELEKRYEKWAPWVLGALGEGGLPVVALDDGVSLYYSSDTVKRWPSGESQTMQRSLHIDPADPSPIWRQIEDGLRRMIASGVLEPSSPVPSVREMARDLRVNPATVSKAYQRLTQDGLLEVKRGEGTFVAHELPAASQADQRKKLQEAALGYASFAATLGTDLDTAQQALEIAWAVLRDGKGSSDSQEGDPS